MKIDSMRDGELVRYLLFGKEPTTKVLEGTLAFNKKEFDPIHTLDPILQEPSILVLEEQITFSPKTG